MEQEYLPRNEFTGFRVRIKTIESSIKKIDKKIDELSNMLMTKFIIDGKEYFIFPTIIKLMKRIEKLEEQLNCSN